MHVVAKCVLASVAVGCSFITSVGCRTIDTPTESSASAVSSQTMTRDEYFKTFNQKVKSLTPVEDQAILAATVGSVFTEFKKKLDNGEISALGISVEKAKEEIKKNPEQFKQLMNSKVTLAELAKISKISSVKEMKPLSAAWSSDLDAFPIDDMWPNAVPANLKVTKTGVIDPSSNAGQKSLQLVDIGGNIRLLGCGAAIAGVFFHRALAMTTYLGVGTVAGEAARESGAPAVSEIPAAIAAVVDPRLSPIGFVLVHFGIANDVLAAASVVLSSVTCL